MRLLCTVCLILSLGYARAQDGTLVDEGVFPSDEFVPSFYFEKREIHLANVVALDLAVYQVYQPGSETIANAILLADKRILVAREQGAAKQAILDAITRTLADWNGGNGLTKQQAQRNLLLDVIEGPYYLQIEESSSLERDIEKITKVMITHPSQKINSKTILDAIALVIEKRNSTEQSEGVLVVTRDGKIIEYGFEWEVKNGVLKNYSMSVVVEEIGRQENESTQESGAGAARSASPGVA